jgi:formate hydrogenlyase transcriptional activator
MAASATVCCSPQTSESVRFQQIVGNSPALESVLKQVQLVGPTDSTVLILGETGTGKELIASGVHSASPRCGRPFVKLNCAAIPAELLESELFGHERGAFTGAVAQRIGRFEAANAGTLFLDEIGDIPLALQAKLLRVLQEQEFERLGSTITRRADVRIVAATNQDLVALVAGKQFRMDLYYRLNVFPIAFRRSASACQTSRCWSGTFGRSIARVCRSSYRKSLKIRWTVLRSIHGLATFASCRISSNAP